MRGGTERTINVAQGEHYISTRPGEVIVTVLGSCVAACLRDPVAQVGGLNHFLLPGPGDGERSSVAYGLQAMEILIAGLIRVGADRRRLEAKLFGGAWLRPGLTDIGARNAAFAGQFLRREGIRYLGGSLGGNQGRRIRYWPMTGEVQQFLLAASDAPLEQPLRTSPKPNEGLGRA